MPKTRWLEAGSLSLALFIAGCALAQPAGRSSASPPAQAVGTQPPSQAVDSQLYNRHQDGVALLLPLSGAFAATAEAVRDGFLAAHFQRQDGGEVRVYDTGRNDDGLRLAYQQALTEGAAVIVGPLRKESVALLASWQPPVPVIGLNFLDADATVPFNFFQMGLAPEDEARAAAEHALRQGLRRAVALVPSTDAGERALNAFAQRLRAGGGDVAEVARYTPGQADQSKLIEALLGGAASAERHRALSAILGTRPVFESRRRGDIELIFIMARAQDARLLMPQLRFHRSGDLPVYATSLVYDGRFDADRAGLRFCDTPWTVGDALVWDPQRLAVQSLPSARALPRLHALGRDAQRIASGLMNGNLRAGEPLAGASGDLSWQPDGRIQRAPECAQLRSDGLQPLEPALHTP